LLEESFETKIKEGFVVYLDKDIRRHIPINPFLRLEVKQLIAEVNKMLASIKIPKFCDSINKCKACGLRQQCNNQKLIAKLIKNTKDKA
jgi:CRISPR/Cas system-associated exonuclease Cas4 (RecB family)